MPEMGKLQCNRKREDAMFAHAGDGFRREYEGLLIPDADMGRRGIIFYVCIGFQLIAYY